MNKFFSSYNDIKNILDKKKQNGKSVVFTNGCFDIVHSGHIEYLKKAKKLGDFLIIGINSDDSIRKLKGDDRPVFSLQERALLLESFYFVDALIPFDSETPIDLIKSINPNILVKGGDYKLEKIIGYDFVIESGGSVKTIDFLDGFSSSKIISKIKIMN